MRGVIKSDEYTKQLYGREVYYDKRVQHFPMSNTLTTDCIGLRIAPKLGCSRISPIRSNNPNLDRKQGTTGTERQTDEESNTVKDIKDEELVDLERL